jgi:ankyrin repeat protein
MRPPARRYIDTRAENGLTALHLAAHSGELECVRLLLDSGASMMVRTVDSRQASPVEVPSGSTPLHLAAMRGDLGIVQAMLQVRGDHGIVRTVPRVRSRRCSAELTDRQGSSAAQGPA